MLNRNEQRLLGALGAGMAADALLDRLRERGTLEGGRSAAQAGCWINYNRKAVWLEDHSEFSAAFRAAGADSATDATQAWRRIRPKVVLKVTWTQAAAYGATLPHQLRTELVALRQIASEESRAWWESSSERGGWPWRRRFATDEEHKAAETEWDTAYSKHLTALGELRDRQKTAIARALPLTVDDEPVDLLELLDQQPAPRAPAESAAKTPASALQAAALHPVDTSPRQAPSEDDGLFKLPSNEPAPGR